jgi:hypothetical protein
VPEELRPILILMGFLGACICLGLSFKSMRLAKELKKLLKEESNRTRIPSEKLQSTIKVSIGFALAVATIMMLLGDVWGTTAWVAFSLFQYRNLARTRI